MIFTRRKNTRVPDTEPVYLTAEGLENLKRHLEKLKAALPKLIDETQKAAAFGDRSDNAEYKESKYALNRTHSQIRSAEDKLKRATLIKNDPKSGVVQIGSTVVLKTGEGKERTFEIVGSVETNPGAGRISHKSPLGAGLLGLKTGDRVTINMDSGKKEYTILRIM